MDLIDEDVLRQLEADTSDGLVAQILGVFCDEASERVAKVVACASTRDLEGIAAHAHALKSGAATFGAPGLQAVARSLEHASRSGDQVAALARVPELEETARISLGLLREYAGLAR